MAEVNWHGAVILLVTNVLTHLIIFHGNPQTLNTLEFLPEFFIISVIAVGTTYLTYPLLGLVGDRSGTRRYWILLGGVFLMILGMVAAMGVLAANYRRTDKVQGSSMFWLYIAPVIIMLMVGIGMVESNGLQFGVDQIAQAKTKSVMHFIKWYFWTHYCGHLIMFYIVLTLVEQDTFKDRTYHNRTYDQEGGGSIFVSGCVLLFSSVVVLCLIAWCSRRLTIVSNRQNPFKLGNVFRVLLFMLRSWMFPTRERNRDKSIFDNCIERNGGPFPVEVVEDVKNFLHISSIMLVCSMFHLSGDTYSLFEQLIRQTVKCPPLSVILTLGVNPNHMTYVLVFLAIPVEVILTNMFNIKGIDMLKRIFIGLVSVLAGLCSQILMNTVTLANSHWKGTTVNTTVSQLTSKCLQLVQADSNATVDVISDAGLEVTSNTDRTTLLFWSVIIPQVLNGVGLWFISMTMLQFICAQASREIQGVLIGGWYAMYSVRFLLVGILDVLIHKATWWFCYKGISFLVLFFATFIFVCLAYGYQYRERDDGVITSNEENAGVRVWTVTRQKNRRYQTFEDNNDS